MQNALPSLSPRHRQSCMLVHREIEPRANSRLNVTQTMLEVVLFSLFTSHMIVTIPAEIVQESILHFKHINP